MENMKKILQELKLVHRIVTLTWSTWKLSKNWQKPIHLPKIDLEIHQEFVGGAINGPNKKM